MGTSCKKIHILKKIRKEIRKKIQEDTFNGPVSTPYGNIYFPPGAGKCFLFTEVFFSEGPSAGRHEVRSKKKRGK